MGLLLSPHGPGPASPWIQRWSHLVAPGATVLDVACGQGRHTRWFAALGHPVTGVDRAPESLRHLDDLVAAGKVERVQADIENAPWPLVEAGHPRKFGAVVVTHYLWRPLLPVLLDSLTPGGVLLYETFAHGNGQVGKPSRPDFLLQPQELLSHCRALRVVAFEDGFCDNPPRYLQRIAAVQAGPAAPGDDRVAADVPRYLLPP